MLEVVVGSFFKGMFVGTIYRQNQRTAGRVIDGLAFVITPDDNKLHTLNRTATDIWSLAKDGVSLDAIAGEMAQKYVVDVDTATADAMRCCDDLVARGILVAE